MRKRLWGAALMLTVVAAGAKVTFAAGAAGADWREVLAQATALSGATPMPDLAGKVVVVNLWATWCQPCIAEMPELNRLVDRFAKDPVVFVALTDEDAATVRPLFEKDKMVFKYHQRVDGAAALTALFAALPGSKSDDGSRPQHFVFGPKGELVYSASGVSSNTAAVLRSKIEAALGRSAAPSDAAKAKPVIDPAAAEVLDRHLAATGAARYAAITSEVQRLEIEAMGKTQISERKADYQNGRCLHSTQVGPFTMLFGNDGTTPWMQDPSGARALSKNDPQYPMVAKCTRHRPPLLEYRTNGKSFHRLPDETLDGQRYLVVASEQDEEGVAVPVRYYFHAEDFTLRREVTGDPEHPNVEVHSDFRPVAGLLRPFAYEQQGSFAMKMRVLELQYDVPLDAALFAMPANPAPPPQ